MDYTLAKELWEAGFPLGRYGKDESDSEVPTLSELIEACGGEFFALSKLQGDWTAIKRQSYGSGSTPEIAVARLWLSLKK